MKKIIVTEQQLSYLVSGKYKQPVNEEWCEDCPEEYHGDWYSEYRKEIAEIERMYYAAYRHNDYDMGLYALKKMAAKKMPLTAAIDNNGEPLVVYHFTPSNPFNIFDHDHGSGKHGTLLGKRFYFSKGENASAQNLGDTKMKCFINITNPYYADFPVPQKFVENEELMAELFGKNWKQNPYIEEKLKSRRGICDLEGCYNKDFISRLGYDGLYWSGKGALFDDPQYAVNSPSQIKSAEPFTFDDNGELIPLDQRFDFSKNDIRY